MLGLPKTTELKKQLPKSAIYTKFNMNRLAKDKFDADISRITIVNEISPVNTTITKGDEVESIFVLLVSLKKLAFDEKNIALISKLINQKLIFVLEYENSAKLAIYHTKLLQTNWTPSNKCTVSLKGLNLDAVWENCIRKIADNEELGVWNAELSLDENIEEISRREKLQKDIERLEKQARNEQQPRKKFDMAEQVRALKKELEELYGVE